MTRIPLVPLIEGCAPDQARAVILMLARGAVQWIREDKSRIAIAESMIFYWDILVYCRDRLRDERLTTLISHGMEIDDIDRFLPHAPGGVPGICDRVAQRIEEYWRLPQGEKGTF